MGKYNVNWHETKQMPGRVNREGYQEGQIIEFCREARSRAEIMDFIGIKSREHFRVRYLNPLLEAGKLQLTEPLRPRSKTQRYISKKQGMNRA